jgi:hypothetical protein
MGYAILIFLTLLAALGSTVAGYRLYQNQPLKAFIAALGIWMLLIAAPPYLLGWIGLLTPMWVGIGSAFASLGTLVFSLLWVEEKRKYILEALLSAGRVLVRGVVLPWRSQSLILLGPLAVLLLALWTAYLAYLVPSCAWDGLWYHESIVGFSIQNQGFDWVPVPRRLEYVNGYPRMSEIFNLFAVIFTGRYLIDVVPSFMMIIAFASMVGLCRPCVSSPVHALGWASVLALLPAVVLQLRTSLTDVTFLAGFTSALFFVTRPRIEVSDGVLGGLLTGMMGAMKGIAVAIAPIFFAIIVVRLVRRSIAQRSPRALLPIISVVVAAALLFAPGYLRNWMERGNPIWPVRLNVAGIVFDGPVRLKVPHPKGIKEILSPPRPEQQSDTRDNGYGNTPPFLIPPLVLAALVALIWSFVRRRHDDTRMTLLLTLLAIVPSLVFAPLGLWWARLNLHAVVLLLLLAAWVIGGDRQRFLAEGVLGALIVGSLLTLIWSQPTWSVPLKKIPNLVSRSAASREKARFRGTMPPKEIAVARDRELKEGDVVAFDASYRFIAGLWNLHFSNRLIYLDPKETRGYHLEHLDEMGARWVVIKKNSAWDKVLEKSTKEWCLVGPLGRSVQAYGRCSVK